MSALLDTLNKYSGLAAVAFTALLTVVFLFEDSRASTRWESQSWELAVEERVRDYMSSQSGRLFLEDAAKEVLPTDLATKSDLAAIEKRIERFERPLLAFLYREGIIE